MITSDLSEFGPRELEIAIRMLTALKERNYDFLIRPRTDLELTFNKDEGDVYLIDEDGNRYSEENGTLIKI